MLKSPSSILNSIKKMKSNLRNDKEQLKIIKNNFTFNHNNNQNQKHENSSLQKNNKDNLKVFSSQIVQKVGVEKQQEYLNGDDSLNNINKNSNKQNINIINNLNIKDEDKKSFYKVNGGRLNKSALGEANNNKDENNISSLHNSKIRRRLREEMEELMRGFEQQKLILIHNYQTRIQSIRDQYEQQVTELMLEINLYRQKQAQLEKEEVDQNGQVNGCIDMPTKVEVETQTDLVEKHTVECVSVAAGNSSNSDISRSNDKSDKSSNGLNDMGLKLSGNQQWIEELQLLMMMQPQSSNEQQQENKNLKYQKIINHLLEQNVRLQNKLEKLNFVVHNTDSSHGRSGSYVSGSNSNSHNSNNSHNLFKSGNINYKTVRSYHNSNNGIQKYSNVIKNSNKLNASPSPIQSVGSFTSQLNQGMSLVIGKYPINSNSNNGDIKDKSISNQFRFYTDSGNSNNENNDHNKHITNGSIYSASQAQQQQVSEFSSEIHQESLHPPESHNSNANSNVTITDNNTNSNNNNNNKSSIIYRVSNVISSVNSVFGNSNNTERLTDRSGNIDTNSFEPKVNNEKNQKSINTDKNAITDKNRRNPSSSSLSRSKIPSKQPPIPSTLMMLKQSYLYNSKTSNRHNHNNKPNQNNNNYNPSITNNDIKTLTASVKNGPRQQHHVRMRTEVCERPKCYDSQITEFKEYFDSRCQNSSMDKVSEKQMRNNQDIKNNDNNPNPNSRQFRFYYDSNQSLQNQSNAQQNPINPTNSRLKTRATTDTQYFNISKHHQQQHHSHQEQEDESTIILDDEMKLKTIKTFNCLLKN